jgi:uracil-DNA glycosylase
MPETFTNPDRDCPRCDRLCNFRKDNRQKFPDKYNGPVPSFGPLSARLLIVGLAPGLRGANFSGRPFTGDYAGDLLYSTLLKYNLARGVYGAKKDDGIELVNTRVTNAVRCVPPQNKPTPDEIKTCRTYLVDEIAAMPNLRIILTLGLVSHESVLRTLAHKPSAYKFAHAAVHRPNHGPVIVNTYHSSRYNVNTNRLTVPMFHQVFDKIIEILQ